MTAYSQVLSNDMLAVTDSARDKISSLVRDTNGEASAVRIYVSGGGCSGMNYGMTFAEDAETKDSIMSDDNGFKMVVDPIALAFLEGAEVDYVDDGINASFVFNNVFQAVGGSGACGGVAEAVRSRQIALTITGPPMLSNSELLLRRFMLLSTMSVEMSGDENDPPGGSDDTNSRPGDGTGLVAETAKPKLKKPPLYKVLILNDDYTPMEFVVVLLMRFFNMPQEKAEPGDVAYPYQGCGRLRCVLSGNSGNQSEAGAGLRERESASVAVHDGERLDIGVEVRPCYRKN